jgi:hypothetical protein
VPAEPAIWNSSALGSNRRTRASAAQAAHGFSQSDPLNKSPRDREKAVELVVVALSYSIVTVSDVRLWCATRGGAQSGAHLPTSRGLGVVRMQTRRWRARFGAIAAGALLAGPAMASTAVASAAPAHPGADAAAQRQALLATGRAAGSQGHQQSLPGAGFDGMAVAAIGTGLTGTGWLLMLVAGRQRRRGSRQ